MRPFRWIFTPPEFEKDAEKTRRAQILNIGSILVFIFSFILFGFNLEFGSQAEKSINWILGLIAVLQILIQWMIRSGHVNVASFVLLTVGWAAMTEISRYVDGIHDVAILGYVLIMLGSGYLLGWRIAFLYTLASIAAIWWLAFMETKGVIIPSFENPYRYALDQTVLFTLIFLIVYFLIITLSKSLEKAERELVERRRVEQTLEKEQERLHLALDAARMGTWNWDIETGAISWSEEVTHVFKLESDQIDGQSDSQYEMYLSLIHPDDLPEIQQRLEKVLSGELTEFIVAHRTIWPNGDIRWLESRGKAYCGDDGKSIRLAGTIVDITDRKRAETERERLIQELETKNEELEQFTYTVSHD